MIAWLAITVAIVASTMSGVRSSGAQPVEDVAVVGAPASTIAACPA